MMYMLTAPILRPSGYVTYGPAAPLVIVRPRLTVARIQAAVCDFYGLDIGSMTTQSREKRVARPRQVAMYLANRLTPKTSTAIGRCFGNRDHTTVLHAIKRIEQLQCVDEDLADDVRDLSEALAA